MIAEYIYDLLPNDWPKVIGDLPATSTTIVGVMEYDGATSTEFFGSQHNNSMLRPIVKIVIRHTSYEIGQQWATEAKEILHRYHDDKLLNVLLVGTPIYLGRSPEKLHEFQVTFNTIIKE